MQIIISYLILNISLHVVLYSIIMNKHAKYYIGSKFSKLKRKKLNSLTININKTKF